MNKPRIGVVSLVLIATTGCMNTQRLAESYANLSYYRDVPNAPTKYHLPIAADDAFSKITTYLDNNDSIRVHLLSNRTPHKFVAWTWKAIATRRSCSNHFTLNCPMLVFTQALVLPSESGSTVMFRVSYYDVDMGLKVEDNKSYSMFSYQPEPREESYGGSEQKLFEEIFPEI